MNLLLAFLRAADRDSSPDPECIARVRKISGVRWLHEYVPGTHRLDAFVLAGLDADAEVVAERAVQELRGRWFVHAGVFRWRIGGVPGEDYLRGAGPVSVFACDAKKESEDEWNEYYDTVHFPNVVRLPIYLAGARYVRAGAGSSDFDGPVRKYLVVYELRPGLGIEALDPGARSPQAAAEYADWIERGQPLIENAVSFAATPRNDGTR